MHPNDDYDIEEALLEGFSWLTQVDVDALIDAATAEILALVDQPVGEDGWQDITSAPGHGAEYLGGRWDDGLWKTSVLRGYAGKPFTHWHQITAPLARPETRHG